MRAGFNKVKITPQRPVELWGFGGRSDKAKGVLSDLFAKSLVVCTEKDNCALITLDLGGINKMLSESIKRAVSDRVGIKEENICVTTTHTHAAPAALPLRFAGTPDDLYLNEIKKKILESVELATKNIHLVKAGFGRGKLTMSVNRREMGIKSDVNQKEGTIDPDVSVIRIDYPDGSPFVLLVNYTAHPVTLYADNFLVSSDYPGEACYYIEKNLNCEMMFLQGACGNINPKIFGSYNKTQQLGFSLGSEVVKVVSSVKSEDIESLFVRSQLVTLPLDHPLTIDQIKANYLVQENQDKKLLSSRNQAEMAWARDLVDYLQHHEKPIAETSFLLQIVKFNDIFLLFLPGEIFVETGLKIKQRFPHKKIIVVAYSNDCSFGYLPTFEAFEIGGYEVEEAYQYYGLFRFAPQAEKILMEQSVKMIDEL